MDMTIEYESYEEDLLVEMLEDKDKEMIIESSLDDPLDSFILD